MEDFVFTAMVLKAIYALAGVFAAILFSRWLDRRAGINFAAELAKITSEPLAGAIYFGARILGIMLLLGMLVGCGSASAGTLFPTRYDPLIRSSVAKYWPDHPDWLVWRAQLYQESRLNPSAVSPVGAAGLAQFMPGTWRQVVREMRLPASVSPHSEIAIEAGAYYMARLRRSWSAPRPSDERQFLAQASYNAGLGNILGAQVVCRDALLWRDIAPCLPQVTGRHAAETIGYVTAIARWRARMIAEGASP